MTKNGVVCVAEKLEVGVVLVTVLPLGEIGSEFVPIASSKCALGGTGHYKFRRSPQKC